MALLLSAIFAASAFTACQPKAEHKFSGVVETAEENSMLVASSDNAGFDKALVSITSKTEIMPGNAKINSGDIVTVTYDGTVRESYPVQITALKIEIAQNNESTKVSSTTMAKYEKITPEQAKKLMESEKNIIILDVRTPEEYTQRRIKNSVLIPDYELEAAAPQKLADKNQLILVYCRSGRRSEASAKLLVGMGYTNVKDFGGIIDWPYDTVSGE